jgi:virulence-associated protein VapD
MGHNTGIRRSMYAITFDMDTAALQASYHTPSWQNAYNDIGRVLHRHGFGRQQGSVYFGDDTVDAVRCVLAVQELARAYVWFTPSVRDIRMLRIEDNNDLMPAVAAITSQ